ncbi:hypothetical protein PM082_006176 [Marasmius tenuissimus]|nr:hypothetical protein PM082_006176 [Marasmius tenuissimus]
MSSRLAREPLLSFLLGGEGSGESGDDGVFSVSENGGMKGVKWMRAALCCRPRGGLIRAIAAAGCPFVNMRVTIRIVGGSPSTGVLVYEDVVREDIGQSSRTAAAQDIIGERWR